MTHAHLIKTLRARSNLTQIEFAKALGVSQGAVSKFEHGLLEPRASVFVRAYRLALKHGAAAPFDRVLGR